MQYPIDNTPCFRYVVLDENGMLLNRILVAYPYPENYYPGYGRYIVYADNDPAPPIPDNLDVAPNFTYLTVRPSMPMAWGSQMDILTGQVTLPVPPVESQVDTEDSV